MRILELESLSCGYHHRAVLSDIEFDLEAGEVLILIGPNGSGKTTLFRTIAGSIPPISGRVRIGKKDPRRLKPKERACLVARVIQSERPSWPFEVREAVAMGLYARTDGLGKLTAAQKGEIEATLEKVGISGLAERKVTELSGGEFQLVLIARALVQHPALLLLDEPVSNLDVGNQVTTLELARRIAGEGVAVAASLHDLNLASLYADRIALVSEGRLRAIGLPGEVLTAETLGETYRTELLIAPHPGTDRPLVAVAKRPEG